MAVAYFGLGGAQRLPLPAGSRLAVDASEPTVRAGATCPAELLELVRNGVDVYSRPHLHAKVFVFGRTALVGSANVSAASADRLVEAVVRTTDPDVVRSAREFVLEMCEEGSLGPEALRKLQKLYRPPRRVDGQAQATRKRTPRIWLEDFEDEDYPDGSEMFAKHVLREAKQKAARPGPYKLDESWRPGEPRYHPGDTILMLDEAGMADPPGRVIHVRQWSNGQKRATFVITEHPEQRRAALRRIAKELGYGWGKRLSHRGRLPRATANGLLSWWDARR